MLTLDNARRRIRRSTRVPWEPAAGKAVIGSASGPAASTVARKAMHSLYGALRDLRNDTSGIRAYLCIALISGLSVLSIDSQMTPETASGSSNKLKQCCGIDQKYSLNSAELGAGVQLRNRVRRR